MKFLILLFFAVGTVTAGICASPHRLFADPPREARLQAFWHWASDCVTREGITRDLEAMADAGISTAYVYCPHVAWLPHSTPIMSDKWLELFAFAIAEAKRCGMDLGFHNCPGWSSSGGPWIAPEDSMKKLVARGEDFESDGKSVPPMPQQPECERGFYRDVEIWAFPLEELPQVVNNPGAERLECNAAGGKKDEFEWEFAEAASPASFAFVLGEKRFCARVTVEAQEEGGKWTRRGIRDWNHWDDAHTRHVVWLKENGSPARRWRVKFERGANYPDWLGEREIALRLAEFSNAESVRNPEEAVRNPQKLAKGKWRIVRLGYTTTGKGPAPATVQGLECDKFSKAALEKHWAAMPAKIMALPGARGTVKYCCIDSYEAGMQNWTENFREEYERRTGRKLGAEVLCLTGYRVSGAAFSAEARNRFVDVFSELIGENYYDHFTKLCHDFGLKSMIEPYGGQCRTDRAIRNVDIPQCEFWLGPAAADPRNPERVDEACGKYGKNILGCEAFTTGQKAGRWQITPDQLRKEGDAKGWIEGVNQIQYHSYLHQPYVNLRPGLSLHRHGTHLNVNTTWWKEMKCWSGYVARGQALLQAGARYRGDDRDGKPSAKGPAGMRTLRRDLEDGARVYFVLNASGAAMRGFAKFAKVSCTEPEWFDAVDGKVKRATVRRTGKAEECEAWVELPEGGSGFLVFSKEAQTPAIVDSEPAETVWREKELLDDGWEIVGFEGPGAPEPRKLEKLKSWTEFDDEGLKHFSGWVKYRRKLGGTGGWLDLGNVADVAVVKVDGKRVACLWQPPWRVELPKGDVLEVEVANTWQNRMIGDAKARKAGAKEEKHEKGPWPLWVERGEPDSGTGIYTWSNFDWAWKAEDPLKSSGLLGPVRIVEAVKSAAERR